MLAQIGMVLLHPKKICSGTGYGDTDLKYLSIIIFDDLDLQVSEKSCTCWIILHYFCCMLCPLFILLYLIAFNIDAQRGAETQPTCISETLAMCVCSSRPSFSTWSWEATKFDFLKPILGPNLGLALLILIPWGTNKSIGDGLFWLAVLKEEDMLDPKNQRELRTLMDSDMLMLPKNNEHAWWALLCNRSWTSWGFTKHQLIFQKRSGVVLQHNKL